MGDCRAPGRWTWVGGLCTWLRAWTMVVASSVCAVLMRSCTMQAATAEGDKGSQQLVFALPESPSSKFHTHRLQEIKQSYSTTKTPKTTNEIYQA